MEEERLEEMRQRIDSARREIARILYEGNPNWEQDYESKITENPEFKVENEYEHAIEFQLDDNEVDRVQELRAEIKDLSTQIEKAEKKEEPEEKRNEGEDTNPTGSQDPELSDEEWTKQYREKMTKESAANIRMDEIKIRMMEIRSILEDPNSELTDADKMKLETERYNLQVEFENLAGIEHANPSGPSLSNQPIVHGKAERDENNAERDLQRKIAQRDKRLNELRIEMLRLKAELDAKGITEPTPELKKLHEEFEQLSKMIIGPEPVATTGEVAEPKKGEAEPAGTTRTRTDTEPEGKEGKPTDPVKQADQEIAEKQEKLARIVAEIEQAGKDLEKLKKEKEASKEELDKLKAEIDKLTEQRDALKTEIADLEKKKAELTGTKEPGKEGETRGTDPTGKTAGAATGTAKTGEEEEEKKGEEEAGEKGKGEGEGEEPEDKSKTKKPAPAVDNSMHVQGFWANAIITIILALRKLTGKDDFGENTIQKILAKNAAKVYGPHFAENDKRIKDLQRIAKAEAKAKAKEEETEDKAKEGEPEEKKEEGKAKPKAKKKGFFARLFSKEDEEEEREVIPRSSIHDDLFDVEETTGEGTGETHEEEEPEMTQAMQDFTWMYQALIRNDRDQRLNDIASGFFDGVKGLTPEEAQEKMQEMIENGEMVVYSDSLKPKQCIVISKTISKVQELAKEFGISLEDENGPVPIERVFAEVDAAMELRDGMRRATEEVGRQAAEGVPAEPEPKGESKDSEGR